MPTPRCRHRHLPVVLAGLLLSACRPYPMAPPLVGPAPGPALATPAPAAVMAPPPAAPSPGSVSLSGMATFRAEPLVGFDVQAYDLLTGAPVGAATRTDAAGAFTLTVPAGAALRLSVSIREAALEAVTFVAARRLSAAASMPVRVDEVTSALTGVFEALAGLAPGAEAAARLSALELPLSALRPAIEAAYRRSPSAPNRVVAREVPPRQRVAQGALLEEAGLIGTLTHLVVPVLRALATGAGPAPAGDAPIPIPGTLILAQWRHDGLVLQNTLSGQRVRADSPEAEQALGVPQGGGSTAAGPPAPVSHAVTDQASLEALRGLAVITGNLTVTRTALSAVALPHLERVDGDVVIEGNAALTSLALPALGRVGGRLVLTGNDVLPSVGDWGALTEVAGDLEISWNALMTRPDGFGALGRVGGTLAVAFNPRLVDVQGFTALTRVGALSLRGLGGLTSLVGLAPLRVIDRDLQLADNPVLTDLGALAGLTRVGGDLTVSGLAALGELRGFEGLTALGGRLVIDDNDAMVRMAGLDALESLGGLAVLNNAALGDLAGFRDLNTVTGGVELFHNPALTALGGLGRVTRIGAHLAVNANDHLPDLAGLAGLVEVGGYLSVTNNPLLAGLSGLEALTRVGDLVSLQHNGALSSLAALSALRTVGRDLTVMHNGVLPCAEAHGLAARLGAGVGGIARLSPNAGACP